MGTLDRFYAEVTDRGGEACLPRSLSDEWLRVVAGALDELLAGSGNAGEPAEDGSPSENEPEAKAIGLAAVLTILRAKASMPPSLELEPEALWQYLTEYRAELAFEDVHRHTDIKCEPASLESIFTNRHVRTWRDPGGGPKEQS